MLRVKVTLGLWLMAVLACGGCPTGDPLVEGPPRVSITTSMGEFLVELDEQKAPNTVQNFLQYVDEGFYDNTIFHRVIPGFVVQGGGYVSGLEAKPTRDPIASEANNGLLNVRGTIAMARTDDPNSATSQFYINLADNAALNATLTSPGYTVFGQVVEGMTVIDQIAAVPTQTSGDFSDVPVEDVVILSAKSEPRALVLAPGWETYVEGVQYGVQSSLRDVIVQVLGQLISR